MVITLNIDETKTVEVDKTAKELRIISISGKDYCIILSLSVNPQQAGIKKSYTIDKNFKLPISFGFISEFQGMDLGSVRRFVISFTNKGKEVTDIVYEIV
jgi:hypothetical protein